MPHLVRYPPHAPRAGAFPRRSVDLTPIHRRLIAVNHRLMAIHRRLMAVNRRLMAIHRRLMAVNRRLIAINRHLTGKHAGTTQSVCEVMPNDKIHSTERRRLSGVDE